MYKYAVDARWTVVFEMDINLKSKSHHHRPTRDIMKEIFLGHLSY